MSHSVAIKLTKMTNRDIKWNSRKQKYIMYPLGIEFDKPNQVWEVASYSMEELCNLNEEFVL